MDIVKMLVDRANEMAKADFSANFDEDCPMTTLAEALTFFAMEGIEDVSEVDSSEVYDMINSLLKPIPLTQSEKDKQLDDLRVSVNRIAIDKFKDEVDKIAMEAVGLEANDLIGDDIDIFHAIGDKVSPMEFVETAVEKLDLSLNEDFSFKKKFRVEAEVITYCYLDVEAYNEDEANEMAVQADGGDFIKLDNGGDFNILKTLTKRVD